MRKKYYIDNEKFYEEIKKYVISYHEAKNNDSELPVLNNYIGDCFLKIANHYSNYHYFIGYSYKDEMIADAVENCVVVAKNFDHVKYSNPFAYFTQIVYFAFRRRIIRERKEQEKKYKIVENSDVATIMRDCDDEDLLTYLNEMSRKSVDSNQKSRDNEHSVKLEPNIFD